MANKLSMVTVEEAVASVQSNNKIFFQGAAMTPNLLIDSLCNRYQELSNVEIIQIHTHGNAKYLEEPYSKSFKLISCFVGDNVRKGVNTNNGDYIPIFLSEIHWLFRRNIYELDVAFIQVSPPDKHGYCSLGTSVDITLPAIQTAKKVIALVNPNVPRTHGDGIIHVRNIDYAVEVNTLAGLPDSAPETQRPLVPSQKYFIAAAILPNRVGLPSARPEQFSRSSSVA